jgi:hypothetical protein
VTRTTASTTTAAVRVTVDNIPTATTIKFDFATELSSASPPPANATTLPKLAATLSSTICKI